MPREKHILHLVVCKVGAKQSDLRESTMLYAPSYMPPGSSQIGWLYFGLLFFAQQPNSDAFCIFFILFINLRCKDIYNFFITQIFLQKKFYIFLSFIVIENVNLLIINIVLFNTNKVKMRFFAVNPLFPQAPLVAWGECPMFFCPYSLIKV
jgi:hypothetical protein